MVRRRYRPESPGHALLLAVVKDLTAPAGPGLRSAEAYWSEVFGRDVESLPPIEGKVARAWVARTMRAHAASLRALLGRRKDAAELYTQAQAWARGA